MRISIPFFSRISIQFVPIILRLVTGGLAFSKRTCDTLGGGQKWIKALVGADVVPRQLILISEPYP